MKQLKDASELSLLSTKEYSILLFFANGCAHCEAIKPVFKDREDKYTDIGFFSVELTRALDYYMQYAEDTQEVVYTTDDQGNTVAVPQVNEDGSPKMVKKIMAPSFYVHHTKAVSDLNPHGWVGGFDGAVEQELDQVLNMLQGAISSVE